MALKDDINVPLCVSVGVLVAVIVAVAVIATEAGYNYVDKRVIANRFEEIETKRPELIYSHDILMQAKENLNKTGPVVENGVTIGNAVPIDQAIKLVAQSKGAVPAK
jgi:hypothetical protein